MLVGAATHWSKNSAQYTEKMDPQQPLLGNQTTTMYSINAMPVYIPPQPSQPSQPSQQEPTYFLRIENSAIIELKDTARWRVFCSTKTTLGWFSKKTIYLIKLQWYDLKLEQEKFWTGATTKLEASNAIMKSIYEQLDAYRRLAPAI